MKYKLLISFISASLASGSLALADNPSTTFGPLNDATFGGTGNPNQAVQVTTYTKGNDTITLGLAAQQRYDNPALGNNGAGTYYATPGSNFKGPGPTLGSLWNFDYYISVAGGGNLGDYTFRLLYDFNPGFNTPDAQLGSANVNAAILLAGGIPSLMTKVQDSQNLLFPEFSSTIPGVITAPAGSYDPNLGGEYTFKLQVLNTDSRVVAESVINVDVPETGSTALMLSLATVGIVAFAARKKQQTA